jgi:hypothetical protein
MLEFPIFWSHRKYDFDDFSEINLKVEWFKLHAYHFLAKAQGSGKENETVSFLRHRLVAAYAELRR